MITVFVYIESNPVSLQDGHRYRSMCSALILTVNACCKLNKILKLSQFAVLTSWFDHPASFYLKTDSGVREKLSYVVFLTRDIIILDSLTTNLAPMDFGVMYIVKRSCHFEVTTPDVQGFKPTSYFRMHENECLLVCMKMFLL